jgi:hypothetical protein
MKIIRFLLCFTLSTTLFAADAVPNWVNNVACGNTGASENQTQITLTPQKPPQVSDDKPHEFWCPQYGYGEEAARIVYGLTSPSNFKKRYYGDHKNAYQASAFIGALAALVIDIAQIESIDKKTSLATPLSLAKNTTGAAFGLKDIYAICANSPNKYYSVAGLSRAIPAIVQWIGHVSNQKLISQNQQAFDAYFKENSTIIKSKNARESAKQMLYLLTGMRFVFAALFSVFTSNFQSANVVCRVAEQLIQAVQQLIIFKVRQDRIKYAISSQALQPEAQ